MWLKLNTAAGRRVNLSVLELENQPTELAPSVRS
jgi:hypothetical protein